MNRLGQTLVGVFALLCASACDRTVAEQVQTAADVHTEVCAIGKEAYPLLTDEEREVIDAACAVRCQEP